MKDKPFENEVNRLYDSEFQKGRRQYFAGDVDGHSGIDTIGFFNG